MQIRNTHRALAALLALVMVVGLLPATVFARSTGEDGSAEINEAYAAHESLMPVGPAFNVKTLLEWTPETDPDAIYSRASVELKPQDRVTGFVVNPQANPEAKLMLCSTPSADHDNTNPQGSEEFFTYAFNYWQYTDSFVYWSGSEEGLICCPTADFIDAAHTNGVPIVATLGFPWGSGTTGLGESYVKQVRDFVQKNDDGTFPVADKLIEVMKYYGFDGYFFNQESYGCSATEGALIDEMMRYMHKKCPEMLISWYDSMLPTGGVSYQNAVTSYNKQFMTDSEDGTRAIDEFFMNYNWYDYEVNTTISTMKSIGRSQFDAFAGFNVQENVYGDKLRDYLLIDEDGVTRLSLALYYANQTITLAKSGEQFHETERTYYVNPDGDPRVNSVDVSDSTVKTWAGMARFFADKTPITKAPFVTNFNTGHGHAYYVDGVKSRTSDWSYQSNQDVLPTWTWIVDSEGSKLAGGYDFTDAYNGGTSVKFSGSLSAGKANDIMLYSTKVAITDGMTLGLTYKGDKGLMKLVAYTGDESTKSYEACTKTELTLTQGEDGAWTTTNADLSALAGKTLYAVGLKIESAADVESYQVNLGRLTILDKSRPMLNGPAKVTLDEILYTDAYAAEARIFWNKVSGASSYEIYKVNADGSRTLIMETPNTAYYIPALKRDAAETDVTLEIVPLNRNGERGKSTRLVIDWAYGNEDSEEIVTKTFENVCLNVKVTGYSEQGDGAECDKALDGTSANRSKWWASGSGDWMSIDLGQERTIRRWRVEHAEYGGEGKDFNTDTFTLAYKNASGEWVDAKRISGNTDAVTDVLLDAPITAREWKLTVNKIGPSPWSAVNIYEWQMFETAEFPATTPVPMHFASAFNGVGEADTLTLKNVPALQTVKVYTKDGDTFTKIGETTVGSKAGNVTLENLDFGTAEAGRIYYSTTAPAAGESAKLSVPFEAENAAKSEPATEIAAEKYSHPGSNTSYNGDDVYVTLTVKGLQPGDVVYIYENGASAGYTKASLPVAKGETSVSLRDVRLARAGGELPMQVKRAGKLISDIYTVTTRDFDKPTAIIRLTARNSLGEALTGVRYDVLNESGEKVSEIGTTSDSGGKVELELGTYTLKCTAVPAGYNRPEETVVVNLRAEGETYEVEVLIPNAGEITDETVLAAQAAQKAAEEAQKAAEEAQKAAEEAQKAAEEAAASTAADKTAAEEAQKKAEEAQKKAEEAREAAKAAQKAAEDAAKAAEASNLAAAQQAAEAAKQAAAAATKANEAAASAAAATEAMQKAQAAKEAAEKARDAANDAQKKAEEAQKKAEEAAASAAEDKAAAEKAKAEAEAAKEAAKAAEEAAKQSEEAAKLARDAAETANKEAAASAALAAEYAQKVAEQYQEIVKMKLEMVEMLAESQKAAEKAEAEQKAAEAAALASAKYYALFNLSSYAASIDTTGFTTAEKTALDAAVAAGRTAIEQAKTIKAVEEAAEAAQKAIGEIAAKAAEELPFADVAKDAWYYEAVKYAYANKLVNGMDSKTFAPEGKLTRAQLVTILYRVAGTPEIKDAKNPFADVKAGEWYTDAIVWAAENGIVKGTSETTFNPNGEITREQIATIMFRYAKAEAVKEDKLGAFPDADKISDYAKDAMNWAVAEGIINGSDGKLLPQDFATRAQIAAILMRYLEK